MISSRTCATRHPPTTPRPTTPLFNTAATTPAPRIALHAHTPIARGEEQSIRNEENRTQNSETFRLCVNSILSLLFFYIVSGSRSGVVIISQGRSREMPLPSYCSWFRKGHVGKKWYGGRLCLRLCIVYTSPPTRDTHLRAWASIHAQILTRTLPLADHAGLSHQHN